MLTTMRIAAAVACLSVLAAPAAAAAAPTSSVPPVAATANSENPRNSRTSGRAAEPGQGRPWTGDPLVIAHRGASGYRPEHTLAAYELAVEMGADYIEPDLVMTRDGVLVDRHEPEISGTTHVADHPEFADRKTTKQVDGEAITGWFVDDFTLAELKTLRAKERLGQLRPESAAYDGQFDVPTFEEVLELRKELSRSSGRTIGVIPEIKHSTYLHDEGFDPEAEITRLIQRHGLNRHNAPVWVQSFELTALKELRGHGYRGRSTFLTTAGGGPYDLRGEGTTYAELTTAESMQGLAEWIDGFGPSKQQIIPWKADGTLGEPTSFVADAHAAGLEVTPWTFRAENTFLPLDYRTGDDPATHGRNIDELVAHFEAGIDGAFCDQPDVCVAARAQFLAN